MRKVVVFSCLLVAGLTGSQLLPALSADLLPGVRDAIRIVTTTLLGFLMIHVGYEFEIDRSRLRSHAVDYGIAATAAAFPWIFCSLYFLLVLMPQGALGSFDAWTQALLTGRFAAPTSASILFFPCWRRPGSPPPGCSAKPASSPSSTISTPSCS